MERKLSLKKSISYDKVGNQKKISFLEKLLSRSRFVDWIIMKFCTKGMFAQTVIYIQILLRVFLTSLSTLSGLARTVYTDIYSYVYIKWNNQITCKFLVHFYVLYFVRIKQWEIQDGNNTQIFPITILFKMLSEKQKCVINSKDKLFKMHCNL